MPAKTEYQNQFESQKQKTRKQKKRNEPEKNRRRTYLGEAQLAQPNTSLANLPVTSQNRHLTYLSDHATTRTVSLWKRPPGIMCTSKHTHYAWSRHMTLQVAVA
jgi:hypothetical protein